MSVRRFDNPVAFPHPDDKKYWIEVQPRTFLRKIFMTDYELAVIEAGNILSNLPQLEVNQKTLAKMRELFREWQTS